MTIKKTGGWVHLVEYDLGFLLFRAVERAKCELSDQPETRLRFEHQGLVIDEPVVGLDPEGIVFMKKVLRRHTEEGGTVFISSHSLDVVESVCTRIGIIHHGKLRAEGSVSEIKARQKSPELVDAFLALTADEDPPAPRA